MQLNALQRSTAQAIVNIFETGSIRGNYGDVTFVRGDSGQLTYGRSQTTLGSGNLYLLIKAYSDRTDGVYCETLRPYLTRLEARDPSLNHDGAFRRLLMDAGDDPVMHDAQDAFFDRVYWDPAMRSADVLGVQSALGAAVVYDSTIHGSWARVRDLTRRRYGDLRHLGETVWIPHYVDAREDWLATHPNALLHKTVYRMEAFRAIVRAGNWDMHLPLSVRSHTITEESLGSGNSVKVPADSGPRRLLRLRVPPLAGPDVEWLQERLTRAGFRVALSGSFDKATDAAVRKFQKDNNLAADGLVGPVTRAALEDLPVLAPSKTPSADEPMPAIPLPSVETATTSTAPAPYSAPAPQGAPAAVDDAIADVKKHVTAELESGLASIRKTIRDEHDRLSANIADTLKGGAGSLAAGLQGRLNDRGRELLKRLISRGHPIGAAGLSAVLLAITEGRDALVWPQSGTPPSGGSGSLIGKVATYMPQTANDIAGYLAWLNRVLHMTATSIPGEWVFRLRIGAIILILYALYRLVRRRFDARKFAREVKAVIE